MKVNRDMQWETVIGLETHAQLSTASKIFSGAATQFGGAPNVQACAVDIALPGVLPVLNGAAVEKAIRFGLAVDAKIAPRSVFARKNYFYPDLPKGYQISQYEFPIVQGGSLVIVHKDGEKTVRLTRAHLEEDAGKSLHEDFHGMSGIDLNRAGTPLLEIVTEPDMRSAEEAVAYAKALHALVRWIGICDGNMQEGSFRCDANVSVRPKGSEVLGTRCEIKNLNSFRFMEEAINYEARRQIELISDGGQVMQETRLYDPDKKETRSMRSKEDAHDYRYFPDPDLLPLAVSDKWIEEIRSELPELPQAKRARYIHEYQLSEYDAAALTADKDIAEYFEQTTALVPGRVSALLGMQGQQTKVSGVAKLVANWVIGDLAARLNSDQIEIVASPVSPGKLAGLLARLIDQTLNNKIAKEVFSAMWAGENGGDAEAIISAHGLKQVSDSGELERIIDAVLAANPKSIEEYRVGKNKAFNALVGQAMKATKGKGNPAQINDILKKKLTR